MSQRELFKNEKYQHRDPWYVSYALPGFSSGLSYDYYGRTIIGTERSRSNYIEKHGAALVFIDRRHSPIEMFKNIRQIPAVAAMFRNRYWVVFYNQVAFVDDIPLMPEPLAKKTGQERPTHFGLKNGAHAFFWEARELLNQCNRIEQFSDCALCRHASDLGECLEVNTTRWARKNGVPVHNVRLPDEDLKDDHTRDPDDLARTLRAQCRRTDLDFVSPGVIAGPFSTKLLYINEMDLSAIEDNIQKQKDRATDAANTRRALLVCESDCYFHDYCNLCTKPYYCGGPRMCQNGKAYRRDAPGPFSEHEVLEAIHREMTSRNTRPREDVALIARYGGFVTKIFGFELTLRKMDHNLQNVEFIHERSGSIREYSFKDAVEILRARYYENGSYSCERWHPERTSPMSDESYLIYAELCQKNNISCGGRYINQPITYVEWRYGSIFNVGIRNNYHRRIDGLRQAGKMSSAWNCLSDLATPAQIKAVREEAGLETTKGRPL